VASVGRILDVGCATGVFLNEMRHRGWETYGVEPGEVAATYAVQRFGLRVFPGELGEAEYPDGSFDVITMWDVLEHVFDPMALLSDANRLLTEGGLLVLSFPNLGSIDVRLFGSCWAGWDVPRHLYAFPRKTFKLMLEKAGFSVLGRRCFFGEQFVFSLSLRFWLQSRVNRSWISALESLAGSYAIRALLKPYFAVVQLLGKGSIITTLARKAQ
jgi:SAM-dependent methyltransferase